MKQRDFQARDPSKQQYRHFDKTPPSCASSFSVTTPTSTSTEDELKSPSVCIGEPLLSDFSVIELPGYDGGHNRLVDTALKTACIEMLESQMQNIMAEKQDFLDLKQSLEMIPWSGFILDLYRMKSCSPSLIY